MQRQVVLAALLASASANPARPDCTSGQPNTDLTMNLASGRIAAATTAITDLKAAKATQDKEVATQLGLKKTAAEAYGKWTGLVAKLDAQGKAGAAAKTKLADDLKAATDAIAALKKAETGPLTVATAARETAEKAVTAQEKLITAAKGVCDKLAAAVKEHDKQASDAVTALGTAKKAFEDALKVSEAAKDAWKKAKDAQTTGSPNVLDVANGKSVILATSGTGGGAKVGDTAITGGGTGTDKAAKIYEDEYQKKATIGYSTIYDAKKSLANGKFATWKTEAAKLEDAEQLFNKMNGLCKAKGQLGAPSPNVTKTCTTLMSTYAEWKKQQDAMGDTQGTAAVAKVDKVDLKGLPGDMVWTSVNDDTTGALTQNGDGYKAAIAAVTLVNLSEGKGYYKTRDAAYLAWETAADVLADAEKDKLLADVEKAKLDCLGNASATHTGTVNGIACESQAKKTATLKATRNAKGILTGAVSSAALNADTWVTAALPAGTGKIASTPAEPKDDVISAAQITAASGGALKVYMQAARDKEVSAEHKRQAGLDSAAAIKSKEALEKPLAGLKADVSVKKYLEKIQQDKLTALEATEKANKDTVLTGHRKDEATQAIDSQAYADDAVAVYKADAATTLAAWNLATARSAAIAKEIKKQEAEKTAAEAALKLATSNCKAAGYQAAQAALTLLTTKQKADQKAYDTLKTTYKKAAILKPLDPNPEGKPSPAGTDCSIPVKDGVAGARPVCEEKLCCGAATKFLRDGTKLAIETCQTATDLTYTYYPPLPKTVVVAAPAPETWRFTCISGAKNLAATATAALAAAYLMA